jgi:hypothetical protein
MNNELASNASPCVISLTLNPVASQGIPGIRPEGHAPVPVRRPVIRRCNDRDPGRRHPRGPVPRASGRRSSSRRHSSVLPAGRHRPADRLGTAEDADLDGFVFSRFQLGACPGNLCVVATGLPGQVPRNHPDVTRDESGRAAPSSHRPLPHSPASVTRFPAPLRGSSRRAPASWRLPSHRT